MTGRFLVARNPEESAKLPFLIKVPLAGGPLVLKAKEPWPRTAKVYCHRVEGWPPNAELLEDVAVRSCQRRGVAIDLVLDRARYAWKFTDQQATTSRRSLAVGDYAVELDGVLIAAVERKTLADLASRLVDGSLLIMLAELSTIARAAVVV